MGQNLRPDNLILKSSMEELGVAMITAALHHLKVFEHA